MVADYLSPQCSQPTEKTLSFISLAPRIPPWLTWDTCREKRPIAAAVCCKLVLRRKLVKNPRKLSCFMNLSDIFLSICFKMFATMTIIYVGNQSKVIWLDIERLFDFSYCLVTNSCVTLFISSTSSLSFFCPDSFHRLFCLWTTFTLSPPPKVSVVSQPPNKHRFLLKSSLQWAVESLQTHQANSCLNSRE